jgi:hypothetical protein
MTQAGWEVAKLHGLAEAVLIVTITFSALMSLVFFLRLGIRLRYQELMREDYLMGAGYVLNLVQNAFACYCAYNGVGLPDSEIPGGKNGPTYNEGLKVGARSTTGYVSLLPSINLMFFLGCVPLAVILPHFHGLYQE